MATLYGIARQRLVLPDRPPLELQKQSEWDRLCGSLCAHIPQSKPPLYYEHDPSRRIGNVTAAKPVTRAQLVARGVPAHELTAPEYLLFSVKPTKQAEAELSGEVELRTSIGLAFDVVDDRGHRWPYYLDELSIVDKPHVRLQPSAEALSSVTLKTTHTNAIRLAGRILSPRRARLMNEILEQLRALIAQIEGTQSAPDAAVDAVEVAETVEEELGADPRIVELERKIAEFEEEKRVTEASAQLRAQIDQSCLALSAEERKEWIKLGLKDAKVFASALKLTARTGGGHPRKAVAGAPRGEGRTVGERSMDRLLDMVAEKAAKGV